MTYYLTQEGREFIREGKMSGSDAEATSARVTRYQNKVQAQHAQDDSDDYQTARRAKAQREYEKENPGGERGPEVMWARRGEPRSSAERAQDKPTHKRAEQIERIRQRTIDRTGGRADDPSRGQSAVIQAGARRAADAVEWRDKGEQGPRHKAKLKWGQGHWREAGKRKGEGRSVGKFGEPHSGETRLSPIRAGNRRVGASSGPSAAGGRRKMRGDRRNPDSHPTITKYSGNSSSRR